MPGASARAKAQFFETMPGASVAEKLSTVVRAWKAGEDALQVEVTARKAAESAAQVAMQARIAADSELGRYRSRPVVEADQLLLQIEAQRARRGKSSQASVDLGPAGARIDGALGAAILMVGFT